MGGKTYVKKGRDRDTHKSLHENEKNKMKFLTNVPLISMYVVKYKQTNKNTLPQKRKNKEKIKWQV